jgi:hypothetical protein
MCSCIEILREYSLNCISLHVSHYSSCQRRGRGFTAYSDTPSRRCGVKGSPRAFVCCVVGLVGDDKQKNEATCSMSVGVISQHSADWLEIRNFALLKIDKQDTLRS